MSYPLEPSRAADQRVSDEITRTGRPAMQCGPYQLDSLIDCGGFSEVWKARRELVDGPAAVKLLRPQQNADTRRRFEREIRLIAKLQHENIVTFYDAGFCSGPAGERVLWLAMELLDGNSLRTRLNEGERFSEEEAVRITYEIASGVARAHDLGVVHRDLKPENVFVTVARVVKVLDFGIAKFNGMWGFVSTGRVRGTLGTPSYMSPEQIDGQPPSYASDVYQICLMLYELCAGRHAFSYTNGELPTQTELCDLHMRHNPQPLTNRGVREETWAVVAKGLSKDPLARYPTGQALAAALWDLLVLLRRLRDEEGGPSDDVNPVSTRGEPLGQEARRAYHPARTPPSDAPPPLPASTVELGDELEAEIVTTDEAVVAPLALPVWTGEAEGHTGPPRKRWEKTERLDPSTVRPDWRGERTMPSRRPPGTAAGGAAMPVWLAVLIAASAALMIGVAVYLAMRPAAATAAQAATTTAAPAATTATAALTEAPAATAVPTAAPADTAVPTATADPTAEPTATAAPAPPRARPPAPRAPAPPPSAPVPAAPDPAPAASVPPAATLPTPPAKAKNRVFDTEEASPR